MPKVSSIDFSILKSIRESVSVRLPDGEVVNLPLISLRDAGIATTFLQRNDTIAVQYSTIQARLQHKAELLSETKDNEDVTVDNGFDAIDATMDMIKHMYKRAEELARENHALCDEIHEFIAPYLKGTKILEQLKECEDIYTIEVLKLMLYGEEALNNEQDEAVEDRNPTVTPSQKTLT